MTHGTFRTPVPKNEPVREYGPGSPEKASLKNALELMASEQIEAAPVVDGERIHTGQKANMVMPHDHAHIMGSYHKAGAAEVHQAVAAAQRAKPEWERMPWGERAAIFLRAGELLATTWRDRINAATMLGQSKTVHQAEIDSACELIDFFRFNVHFAEGIYSEQPESGPGMWNRLEHRPLDGFVFAVTPFNFSSIAGNLPCAPALMGNTCLWKPASTSVYSNWLLMQMLEEAGLPKGVINFLPGSGSTVGDPVFAAPSFAGVHFTGSTGVFRGMWKTMSENMANYGQYPRIVGETGGKDFVVVHPSSDVQEVAVALVRGAFEYQGQKCSAASRAYLPESLWPAVKSAMAAMLDDIKTGDIRDFTNFLGAVIDRKSFETQKNAIEAAKASPDAEVVLGGEYDDSVGYFVHPTVIQAKRPDYPTLKDELFGPVLTVFVYADDQFESTLEICDKTAEYALTGAIFSRDRAAVQLATDKLRFTAGNFYINDKPTGAVVGQQPFGGSRASGTNDKAGSPLNLMRWVSPRTIKETFVPPTDWRYAFLDEA